MSFKIGDKVRCINGRTKGAGWRLGREFTIHSVRVVSPFGNDIAFPQRGNGVYFDSLELVSPKKPKPTRCRRGCKVDLTIIKDEDIYAECPKCLSLYDNSYELIRGI